MNSNNHKKIFFKILVPFLGGFFLTFSKTQLFLYGNQSQYFIYGLKLFNPNFIINDWFTWKTFHHDFAFGWLLYLLQFIGPLAITLILADLLIMVCLAYGLWLLIKKYSKYPLLNYFIFIVWLRLVDSSEIGLGSQYLINGYLQPSEIAGSFMVLGLALLLNNSFFVSGFFLGLAGLFHGAFLSSYGLVIFTTLLASNTFKKIKSLLFFILPLAFFWGIFVLITLKAFATSIPMNKQIASIMINFRAPGDFLIRNWPLKYTLGWIIWCLLGLMLLVQKRFKKKYEALIFCYLTILFINIASVIQAAFNIFPSVTIMMLWRSSSFITVISVMLIIEKGLEICLGDKTRFKSNKILIILFSLFSLILLNISWGPYLNRLRFIWFITIPSVALVGWIIDKRYLKNINRKKISTSIITSIMVFIIFIYLKGYLGKYGNFWNNSESLNVAAVEEWARDKTPKDSIFIIPPQWEFFRIRAQRAIVVDWKSSLFLPSDLNEWYQRLRDETNFSSDLSIPGNQKVNNGYLELDSNRADLLAEKYKVNFVIIEKKKHKGSLSKLEEVYNNEEYAVFKIN